MKRKTIPALTRSELILGWLYLGFELLLLPSAIVLAGSSVGGVTNTQLNLIYYLINFCACAVIFRRLLTQSLGTAAGDLKGLLGTAAAGFFAYYLASTAIGTAITVLFPAFSNANDANVSGMLHEAPLLMTLCVVVLVPIAEECLFRGLLFLPLAKKNLWLGYVVSSLIFAGIHVVGYIGYYDATYLLVALLQYLPASLVLAWALHRSGSLVAPILIHAAVNLVSTLASF